MFLSFQLYFIHNMYIQSSPSGGDSYLLSDLLLHFDGGSQLSHLFNSITRKATVFPQHIILRVRGTNEG